MLIKFLQVSIQEALVRKFGYIHALSDALSLGDCLEEDIRVNQIALWGLKNFILQLRKGRDWNHPTHPKLLNELIDKLEEKGSVEDIELLIYHSKELKGGVRFYALKAMNIGIQFFHDEEI
ncbi:MAG: hypothetical protein EZS28_020742 [Streblomastix strix]|uniref:Uncharacterized protein n=1 Tax=Streblomastix strix TaxID=222440 RepID=A0A5J4VM91_9EUKA|nr:MAG: hypothetical protein EZS28_020742 [Streblomastix strix]